jgi:hypothetical protein
MVPTDKFFTELSIIERLSAERKRPYSPATEEE